MMTTPVGPERDSLLSFPDTEPHQEVQNPLLSEASQPPGNLTLPTGGAGEADRPSLKDKVRRDSKEGLQATATWLDIMALGIITSTLCGATTWNLTMGGGLLPGLTAITLGGVCFTIILMCQAELASALPFSGGCYGYLRLTIGRNVAIVVGLVDVVVYFLNTLTIVVRCGQVLTAALGTDHRLEMLWTLLVYGSVVGIQLRGGKTFWTSVRALAALVMTIQFVYWFIAFATPMSLGRNAALSTSEGGTTFSVSTTSYFAYLSMGVLMYVGIESLPLSAEDTREPRRQLPKGMIASITTVSTLAVLTALVVCSASPGLEAILFLDLPNVVVLAELTKTPGQATTVGCLLALPAFVGCALGFNHATTRVIFSMARAGVLPDYLQQTRHGTAVNATLTVAALGWLSAVLMVFFSTTTFFYILLSCIVFSALFNYIFILVSFIILRAKFPDMPREYISPVGVSGALLGLIMLTGAAASFFIFTPGTTACLLIVVVFVIILASYYVIYARFHLVVTPEELISRAVERAVAADVNTRPIEGMVTDLERLIQLDDAGTPILEELLGFARQLCAEEATHFAVGVIRIRKMGLDVQQRPLVLAAARSLLTTHVGAEARLPIAVSKESQDNMERLMWRASRRSVLFVDDLTEVIDGLNNLLTQLALQLSSVMSEEKVKLGEALNPQVHVVPNLMNTLSRRKSIIGIQKLGRHGSMAMLKVSPHVDTLHEADAEGDGVDKDGDSSSLGGDSHDGSPGSGAAGGMTVTVTGMTGVQIGDGVPQGDAEGAGSRTGISVDRSGDGDDCCGGADGAVLGGGSTGPPGCSLDAAAPTASDEPQVGLLGNG